MQPSEQTPRQRITDLLTGRMVSARQLAAVIKISERQVEDHLTHIIKSVERDRSRRFMLEPPTCLDCGFAAKARSRVTPLSRCPRCRSEKTTAPRYGIELRSPKSERSAPALFADDVDD